MRIGAGILWLVVILAAFAFIQRAASGAQGPQEPAVGAPAPVAAEEATAYAATTPIEPVVESTAFTAPVQGMAPIESTAATASGPLVESTEALTIDVTQAVLLTLENNKALTVQRYGPGLARNNVEAQRAAFDPDLTGSVQFDRGRNVSINSSGTNISHSQGASVQAGVSKFFPTGTAVSVTGQTNITSIPEKEGQRFSTRAGMDVTQSLLRGFGPDVNLASLRQARISYLASEYQLRGFAEALVAQVEETYWNYTLAQRQIVIFNASLKIALGQENETRERIRVGQLAESELAAAQSETALRQQNLIDARAALDTTRVQLMRLLSPRHSAPLALDMIATSEPNAPSETIDPLQEHIDLALRMRSDLNQARLQVNSGDLQVVKTRNGLLPRLDLFATFGRTGASDSYGQSIARIGDGGYDFLAGLQGEYPIGNRAARAGYDSAVASRDQGLEAVANLAESVEVDVRTAYIEVNRSKDQVVASAATRKLQEEKLRTEMEKFHVGRSTTLLVGQAQRDLLQAQIAEIQSVVAYIKAFTEMYRLEGSLLVRRGISCPGREPVTMTSGLGAAKMPKTSLSASPAAK